MIYVYKIMSTVVWFSLLLLWVISLQQTHVSNYIGLSFFINPLSRRWEGIVGMHFVRPSICLPVCPSVCPSVSNILCPCFNPTYALMDYHLTWYKCCPHWDDVQWPWPGSIPQRSRSHNTFNGQSTHTISFSTSGSVQFGTGSTYQVDLLAKSLSL